MKCNGKEVIIIFNLKIFARNKKGIMLIMLEALMLIKFFQTKPYLKNENIDYFDIYYVIILNKLEKEKNETSFKLFQ